MNVNQHICPECKSPNLFCIETNSGGGYGPILLPRLGGFLRMARFCVVVCADCGLTRFYAEPGARAKLPRANGWRRA
jgi:predicted nucleic-acid-binding Zn-ribbon protein